MFKLKEFIFILAASAVLGYVIAFTVSVQEKLAFAYDSWLKFSFFALLILLINIFAKKIMAYKLGCEIEVKPWNIERYGFDRASYFGFPIPAWLIWPLLVVWLSLGSIWWLVVSTFDVCATTRRVGRKFAEVTEWDIALIAVSGILANLLAVVVATALGYEKFVFISLWFVFFNMLPFPAYDGGRIFFGGRIFWIFVFTFSLIILILLHVTVNVLTTLITSLLIAIIAVVLFYSLTVRRT